LSPVKEIFHQINNGDLVIPKREILLCRFRIEIGMEKNRAISIMDMLLPNPTPEIKLLDLVSVQLPMSNLL
jgi:hypothetical protein